MKKVSIVIVLIILATCTFLNGQPKTSEYRISRIFHLTGNDGWDYLSVDNTGHRLFVSHGTRVNVIDLKTGDEIAVINGTNGVHGIALAPDVSKAFISCGRDSCVRVVEFKTLKDIVTVPVTGKNPDAILYDQYSKQVFVFNGRSANATVIGAKDNKIKGTISLSGKPEFPQADGKGRIYVNIEDKSEIAVINAKTLKVEKSWSIDPGEEPSGLALDSENNRLFSVCGNKIMVVSDLVAGKVITTVPIGEGCDGVAFDAQTKRIYASNGEGSLTVIRQENADRYSVSENMPTKAGARTITIDRLTHKIYLSVADRIEGTRNFVKDSFTVLEIETAR